MCHPDASSKELVVEGGPAAADEDGDSAQLNHNRARDVLVRLIQPQYTHQQQRDHGNGEADDGPQEYLIITRCKRCDGGAWDWRQASWDKQDGRREHEGGARASDRGSTLLEGTKLPEVGGSSIRLDALA